MAVHRHRETQFDPHKFWFGGFHKIGVAQTYWYPNCVPFLSNVSRTRRKRASCGCYENPPPNFSCHGGWTRGALGPGPRAGPALQIATWLILLSQRKFHGIQSRRVDRLHPCSPFLSLQTQDSSEGFDPPFGRRSCTPRPRCALSCAQVMRRAVIRSVKTLCQYQHFNHAIFPMSYL